MYLILRISYIYSHSQQNMVGCHDQGNLPSCRKAKPATIPQSVSEDWLRTSTQRKRIMETLNEMSDDAILKVIGRRIARARLNRNMTQGSLAYEAGISTRTLTRIEKGQSVQSFKLLRVLRALRPSSNLDALIPDQPLSPIQLWKLRGSERKRASSTRTRPTGSAKRQ